MKARHRRTQAMEREQEPQLHTTTTARTPRKGDPCGTAVVPDDVPNSPLSTLPPPLALPDPNVCRCCSMEKPRSRVTWMGPIGREGDRSKFRAAAPGSDTSSTMDPARQ